MTIKPTIIKPTIINRTKIKPPNNFNGHVLGGGDWQVVLATLPILTHHVPLPPLAVASSARGEGLGVTEVVPALAFWVTVADGGIEKIWQVRWKIFHLQLYFVIIHIQVGYTNCRCADICTVEEYSYLY